MRPLALALLLAAPAAADLTHPSDSGSFRARFPAPPTLDEKELAVGASRTVPVAAHRATDPKTGCVFAVTVAEYPPAFAEVPAETLLDGVRDGLKGRDGKLKSEEKLRGPHPGRTLRIEAGRNLVRARLVVAGSRLFQVTVAGPAHGFPDKLADEFFAGFEPKP